MNIILDKIEKNEIYRTTLMDLSCPIYLKGDSISGYIVISNQKEEKFPYKRITVKLIPRYSMAGSTVIDEQQIWVHYATYSTGNAKEFKVKFVLNKPNIRIPSYFGKFFKFTYYIEVILKKNILYEVTKTYEIVFLDPESMALASNYTKTEKIDFRPITFDLILDHTQYSTQDNITGLIKFPKNELSGIESIDISISLKETLRGSKSNEEEILRYQVVDGCPMPGSNISFIIQLAPYQLWVTKFDNSNKLNAQYFLHVLLSRHGKDGTYVENVCNVALNLIYKKLENKGKKY